uniref:Uncharacterized protein n=1 Tax=Anguilla anguilla TaxID=7936 RepID=A0A0E9PRZ4_ANGAN
MQVTGRRHPAKHNNNNDIAQLRITLFLYTHYNHFHLMIHQ